MKELSPYEYFNQKNIVRDYEIAFKDGSPFSDVVIEKLQQVTGKQEPFLGGFLADLGCGPGTSINALRVLGFKKFFAADIAPAMIKAASDNFFISGGSLTTELLNVETMKIPLTEAQVDVVALMATTQYMENLENVFQEASRILKPKGFFTLNVTVHNNNSNRYKFLDDDNVIMYLQPIRYIQMLIAQNNFDVIFEGGCDCEISWVRNIDMKEYFLLLQKK